MTAPPNDPLLSETDVSGMLGTNNRTLQSWRWRGIGPPYIKVGRLVRYRQSAIDGWLKANTVEPRNAVAS